MLWKIALAVASVVTSPFREPFEPTRYGPQSWADEILARAALQGEHDDIRYPVGGYPSHAGINSTQMRWPGYPGRGIVAYVLDTDVAKNKKLVQLIEDAMKHYEARTCIRFVKRKYEPQYIKIIAEKKACYSYVGMQAAGNQPQTLSLGKGCEFPGTIVHELGHAIGLFHEHQRSDRDTYINVYMNNVKANEDQNFNKTNPIDELTFGHHYDYTSIMHYGNYAFSKWTIWPFKKKTMEAKDGTPLKEPFEKPGLNDNDIDLIKKLYKCK